MATSERQIETPAGPRIGSIFGKLEILGIASYATDTLNQAHGKTDYEEHVTIDVPVGTIAIVPSPNLWWLGHGRMRDQVDTLNDQTIWWDSADRPWGFGRVHVSVVDINAPDTEQDPPKQTAQLRIVMRLVDYNGDDPWFGLVGYTLMFLGQAAARREPTEARLERMQAIALEIGKLR